MIGRTRLRDNVVANLAGTAVAAGVAVLSAPLIYRWMGADAYGLVGVYVLLQTLMPLFDAGITAGLARAVAWHRERSLGEVRTLVRAALRPIAALAVVFVFVAAFVADPVARHWIDDSTIPFRAVRLAFWWMAGALAVRLVAGLGRASLMALELQSSANAVQAAAAVARTFGALLFAMATDTGVIGFFALQVPISFAEYIAYQRALRRAVPVEPMPVARADLSRHLRFAFGIAGLSAMWLLTSQIDKALLAESLSLRGYGAYSLGVHVASVILLAVGAVHGAVLPRMTRHVAGQEEVKLGELYGIATTLTVAMACAVVVAIAIGARMLVPSLRVSVDGIDPMRIAWLYGIGNAGAALLAMAYQLQNARGMLRMHAVGTVLQMLVQVPLVAWSASGGDAVLTAVMFACVNWAFALVWLPFVHARFLPGGHWHWMSRHLLPTLVTGVVVGAAAIHVAHALPAGWVWGVVALACGAGMTFAAAVSMDADARVVVKTWIGTHAS
ncbi:lipopolysaccharide biosynthesis protein [Dyella sp.]|uniref:lipopolysaccharide biosynthesis protein n=1 Tax=Dyella sp. TaxID=1869338 RepID=UPI003F807BDD